VQEQALRRNAVPKVKQVFGETRFVPWLGREVADGEVVDVPDDDLPGYLEGGWEPADKATKAAHKRLFDEKVVTVGSFPAPKEKPATQADDVADAEAEAAADESVTEV
jgi:hypothetical protein